MIEVVILDSTGAEILRKNEKDFIRAEFIKRERENTGIVNCVSLTLPVADPLVLEPLSEKTGLTVKLVDSERGFSKGIENGDWDEYRVNSSNADRLVEVISVAGIPL